MVGDILLHLYVQHLILVNELLDIMLDNTGS